MSAINVVHAIYKFTGQCDFHRTRARPRTRTVDNVSKVPRPEESTAGS